MKIKLETPVGFIESKKINKSWYSFFLNEIKLGEESPDRAIRSIKRFLNGMKPSIYDYEKLFFYKDGIYYRHVLNLGAPHAAIFVRYHDNEKSDLFIHKAHFPNDIREVLCEITDDYFQKWAKRFGCEYMIVKPCKENTKHIQIQTPTM
jgi:hypothetical protein